MILKNKLNDKQKEAVVHKSGPLLIIAGAGTGKTTVITERIKYLIEKKSVEASHILALTFTQKAAGEMQERVDEALPYGYSQMWISTFHSFCDRILRAEALNIGLDPKYKLLGDSEAIQLVRSNIFSFDLDYFRPLGNPNKFIEGMLGHFSRLQDEDTTPREYLLWAENEKQKKKVSEEEALETKKAMELAKAFGKYEEIKTKEGFLDYGDLIVKTLKLFRDRKNILKKYQKQFEYLLVDEYQDTNYSQNEIVKLLAGKKANITVVADDDQAIYAWRGTSVSNVIQFRKSFPKVKVVTLNKNYRSTREILDRAYDLVQFNNPDRLEVVERIDKKLESARKIKGEKIVFLHEDRVENEAEKVAMEVKKLSESGEYLLKDFAILVRANNHAEPFARAFARHQISYQFLGPGRLFRQPEIIDLIAYLRVIYNFEDSVSFFRVLSMDVFDIPSRDLAAVGNFARRRNISYFEACEEIEEINVSNETRTKIKKVVAIVKKHLNLQSKETAGQILYYFLEDAGLLVDLVNPDSVDGQKRAINISKFFDKLKTYEVDHEDATVFSVVDWINLSMQLGESPLVANEDWSENNAVNILTIHSAKGLEFPIVFLVNLVAQRFPTTEKKEQIPVPEELVKEILPKGDYHLQEERRLFYVGMTRAKDRLYFTAANYYGDGKREKKFSPFIFEALGEKYNKTQPKAADQLSFLGYERETPSLNNKVKKPKISYLSYSQIETFKICPLHYKLRYILNIPTPQSASASFGTSIHLALRDFYRLDKTEQNKKKLLLFLKNSWVNDGYHSKSHEEKFFKKGLDYLSDYFDMHYDKKVNTILCEQPFTIPIFATDKIVKPLRLGGRIDRVDELKNGGIEIIDYKTGANVPTQKEIDRELQMTFYALAAVDLKEQPFNKDPKDVKLTFYYFDNQKKLSTTRTAEDLKKAKEEILSLRDEIEKSNFNCSGNFLCKNCEYKIFCNSD